MMRFGCQLAVIFGAIALVLPASSAAREGEDAPPVEPGKPIVRVEPIVVQANLLPNASFEETEAGKLKSWSWQRRNTDATLAIDDSAAHSGRHSLRITNSTPFGPHVYGMLDLPGGATVKPNTAYTFSCYVKGSHLGLAWFGGGRDWRARAIFPEKTEDGWVRVVLPFTTGPDDRNIPVLATTESPCESFWIDDVQLVEGPRPMPVLQPSTSDGPTLHLEPPETLVLSPKSGAPSLWNTSRLPRSRYVFASKSLWLKATMVVPKDLGERTIVAEVCVGGQDKPTVRVERVQRLPSGTYAIAAGFSSSELPGGDAVCRMRLGETPHGSSPLPKAEASLRRFLVTPRETEARLNRVESSRDAVRARVESLRRSGQDPAYLVVALTILENFVGYAREDVARGELARAYDAAVEMDAMARQALNREFLPAAPRYETAARRPSYRLDGPAQIGTVRWLDGRQENGRPLQLVGLGAFSQVIHDLDKLNSYGCNVIQIEFGPHSVLVGENQVSMAAVDGFRHVLDRAAKANVAVNLLVSPHYFPGWALDKWPHLRDAEGGFLHYDVHAPEARAVLERFLRVSIPRIADHPALHSICLSNEPIFTQGAKSRFVREKWRRWLAREHGTIQNLNARWETQYAAFDAVPIPPTGFRPEPIVYDFVRFNQEAFAEFHAWMAGIIRQMAPDVPIHAKIMMHPAFMRHEAGPWSVAPERFAALSDFNGNDDVKFHDAHGPWASGWQTENAGYDFQRSMADKPVFNSENHLIPDRLLDWVPPNHIANVLWQGAIHGQSATTIWVWERTYEENHDFTGSIMHRPACVEAMGRSGLDLMRLAPEVTAFQRMPVRAALLWSMASLVAGQEYLDQLAMAYEALNFCGVKIGFITEQQLADYAKTGNLPPQLSQTKLLVLAGVSRLPRESAAGAARFPNRVVLGRLPKQDEYGHQARADLGGVAEPKPLKSSREAFEALRPMMAHASLVPAAEIQTADGKPAWGVEFLALRQQGRILVNLCNYLRQPQTCRILVQGKPVSGRDLVSGDPCSGLLELPSLKPVLLEVRFPQAE